MVVERAGDVQGNDKIKQPLQAEMHELERGAKRLVDGNVLEFDRSKPDGVPRKLLDVTRIQKLGWRHRIGLSDGVADAYRWYLEHIAHGAAKG